MKPSELRIGNYVLDTIDKSRVRKLAANFFRVTDFEDVYEPVPLSYEWKNMLGVKITTGHNENGLEILYIKTAYCEVQCSYIYLEYVHQLQNLYFALSERELTLI